LTLDKTFIKSKRPTKWHLEADIKRWYPHEAKSPLSTYPAIFSKAGWRAYSSPLWPEPPPLKPAAILTTILRRPKRGKKSPEKPLRDDISLNGSWQFQL